MKVSRFVSNAASKSFTEIVSSHVVFGSFGVPNGHQEGAAEAFPAAIGYALRNWVALTRYVEDGQLKIDNNGRSRRYGRTCLAEKTGCSRGAKRRRTEPLSCVRWCRPASTCRSTLSCISA